MGRGWRVLIIWQTLGLSKQVWTLELVMLSGHNYDSRISSVFFCDKENWNFNSKSGLVTIAEDIEIWKWKIEVTQWTQTSEKLRLIWTSDNFSDPCKFKLNIEMTQHSHELSMVTIVKRECSCSVQMCSGSVSRNCLNIVFRRIWLSQRYSLSS